MSITEKVLSASNILEDILERASQPAILFSGGKESIVLHHLVRDKEIPHLVLYDEIQLDRLAFIEKLFWENQFFILNFRPCARTVVPTRTGIDLINVYDLRGQGYLQVAISPEHSDDLCIFDWLKSPVRSCPEFVFDFLIAGGRHSDHHDYFGQPFQPEQKLGEITLVNPLHDWEEFDVWAYILANHLSYDKARYEHDTQKHLDSLAICTRCFGKDVMVDCPKFECRINAAQMRIKGVVAATTP